MKREKNDAGDDRGGAERGAKDGVAATLFGATLHLAHPAPLVTPAGKLAFATAAGGHDTSGSADGRG